MPKFARVSPAEAKKLVDEGHVYLDVRSEPEFGAGHPAGARNIPLLHAGPSGMLPNEEFLELVLATFPKDTRLVVGCKSGGRSQRAAEVLEKAGYTAVTDQRAGFDGTRSPFGAVTEPGWAASGLPVESSTPGGSYAELRKAAGRA